MGEPRQEGEPAFTDYYEVLQLHPGADPVMVDQAYWHLAKLYNESAREDPRARGHLDALNEAYSVLRAPSLRKVYDKVRDLFMGVDAAPVARQGREGRAEPPLTVMTKHRPPEEELELSWASRPVARLRVLSVPSWQGLISGLVMLLLAWVAVASGAKPVPILVLLGLGFAATAVRIGSGRRLPSMALPKLRMPSPALGLPRLAERRQGAPADADALRQATEEMRARLRQASEAEPREPAGPPPLELPRFEPRRGSAPDEANAA
jgi:hypothetical protein